MQEFLFIMIGILIPFFGTTIGSATVFFLKNNLSEKRKRLFLGFAAGLMFAASIWSLIIPSINMSENLEKFSWIPATVGLILGCIFFIYMERILPKIENKFFKNNNKKHNSTRENLMLIFAITLHNFPEGMAVGVAFAGILNGNHLIGASTAMALAIGIAIQNFPEGAIISMPLKSEGMSKPKAFLYGMLSGIVEPIGAIITILFTNIIVPFLPYLLSFAAGAMIYVVVEELIPESQTGQHSNIGTIGVAIGFILMMVLDVALG